MAKFIYPITIGKLKTKVFLFFPGVDSVNMK